MKKICNICDKEFKGRKERRFCSRKCYGIWRSNWMKTTWPKEEFSRRIRKGWKNRKPGWNAAMFFTEESKRKMREKIREKALERWSDPKKKAKLLKTLKIGGSLKSIQASLRAQKRRPTKPEKEVMNLIEKLNLPFEYTGDGKFILERYNPDFVDKGNKRIIEVFGDYWHSKEDEIKRKEIYNKYGYSLIVIWQSELENPLAVELRLKEEE